MTIHGASLLALHEHSRATETVALAVPPPGANVVEDAESVGWHRTVPGLVTVVDVDVEAPPQPESVSEASIQNGRARVRSDRMSLG